jgi:predicted nucleotidyltransferase
MLEPLATDDVIREMTERIVASTSPVRVILFGSQARGTSHGGSDVDFLVIERDPVDVRAEAIRLRRLVRSLGVPVDIVAVGQAFADRYWDIPGTVLYPAFKEGRVLYG